MGRVGWGASRQLRPPAAGTDPLSLIVGSDSARAMPGSAANSTAANKRLVMIIFLLLAAQGCTLVHHTMAPATGMPMSQGEALERLSRR